MLPRDLERFEKLCVVKTALTLSDAINAAASQNFERDVSEGLIEANEKAKLFPLYIKEAEALLMVSGENYKPELPQTEHIVLKD